MACGYESRHTVSPQQNIEMKIFELDFRDATDKHEHLTNAKLSNWQPLCLHCGCGDDDKR